MSWTTLDLNNLLAGEPLIESEVLTLYENPIAIAEGAPGAPRVQGIALGGVHAGSGSNSRTSGGQSTVLTVTDLDDASEVFVIARHDRDNPTTAPNNADGVRWSTSTDNGASWSSETQFSNPPVLGSVVSGYYSPASARINVAGPINAVRIRLNQSGSGGTSSATADLYILSGTA